MRTYVVVHSAQFANYSLVESVLDKFVPDGSMIGAPQGFNVVTSAYAKDRGESVTYTEFPANGLADVMDMADAVVAFCRHADAKFKARLGDICAEKDKPLLLVCVP